MEINQEMLPEKTVISAFLSLVLYCNPYLLQFPAAISLLGLLSGELFSNELQLPQKSLITSAFLHHLHPSLPELPGE